MDDSVDGGSDLGQALALVRGLWSEGNDGDLPERLVAWAMMVEAVDRLTVLHGPTAMGHLLEELILAVREVPAGAGGGASGVLQ